MDNDSWKKNPLAGLDHSPALLSQAKNGNREAAKQLIRDMAGRISSGEALSEEVADWLSTALIAIAEGESPVKALHLTKRRGRDPGNSEETQHLIAEFIHDSGAGRHKASNRDDKLDGAYLQASELFGISENTAAKYYKDHISSILEDRKMTQELRDEHE
ncbi:hypothetical protein [Haliea sp.]|jgi:hypothetical protein|uniref:hypothetical protein n=1 Tax=Haliea sp. TaxID=1932666 RepID=UPI000C3986C6|nr:hypothetical protein [Haliea sp.]HCD56565.1 hypothetical protein [Halieaceae bacterium]MAD65185.1 hypothetical protein [Haliea sp.]MAY92947.1 hypothetical protein [Haliea sp.]MBK40434.1 hypothetical protein [Haliea sp.]MBP68815.1 hypothetical protein [Haliea sp.]|tara:strand:+ start:4730 stop:5209 length:480 start_codon:yes stop_codon:yes gene_type:complete